MSASQSEPWPVTQCGVGVGEGRGRVDDMGTGTACDGVGWRTGSTGCDRMGEGDGARTLSTGAACVLSTGVNARADGLCGDGMGDVATST